MVIPVLDEAENVLRLAVPIAGADEVIVVDGGSRDGTPERLEAAGTTVLRAARGRGIQLAAGAAAASGDVLLFLHADTRLPEGAAAAVRKAVAAGAAGGAFRLAYDDPAPALRFVAAASNLRSRVAKLPFGDQALFATREAFDRCGGFRPLPLMEDVDFVTRLRREGRFVLLPSTVTTSARRFREQGVLRTVLRDWRCQVGWALGVPPERLARWYEGE